jgi:hypothetical protein
MMGTVVDKEWTYKGAKAKLGLNAGSLPASFDART